MGKGTIGINPFYHDRQVMHRPAVAGLLAVLVSFTDSKSCKFRPHPPERLNKLTDESSRSR